STNLGTSLPGRSPGRSSVASVDAHALKEAWLNEAFARAGIDRRSWRPARGVAANRRTVEAVYSYYGQLFLDHPHLEWAGMAALIGPAFYAGFLDLGLVPDAWRAAVHAVFGRGWRKLARQGAGDLGFYE